ncbi:MAG: HNH endonuclease [Muribaculaceae bacterium]|nr:HNH endonuclease [Muribaculaceae bacterium]
MNLYLYSKNNRVRVSWASTSNDFEALCHVIEQDLTHHRISGSLVLLAANDKTKKSISDYCRENEEVSRFNSRKIAAFVSKLPMDEWFIILNADVADGYERLSAIQTLDNASDLCDGNRLAGDVQNLLRAYSNVKREYNVFVYGVDETPVYVGEPDKSKRICRFCKEPGKSYKDVAHAIPEALGNTKLFCNEECVTCNHKLNIIEDNLIALMDVRRAMFKIRRKGTSEIPDIDGQDFVIRGDADGNPMVYYKEEALPDGWQNMDVIPVRLNLKYKTTNENIYKALCKIAIDLMPSEYVGQFSETVDWISSDGRFIPDSLPSCHMAVLPRGAFYEQPQLHLYVKADIDSDSPFCFALLNIYDVCYRFIVPFSKPDAGRYRTNDSLVSFWSRFQTSPALTWYEQNTSDWWWSAPWAEFDIKSDAPFFVIKPGDDPIFDNCHDAHDSEEWYYDDFNADELEVGIERLSCKCHSKTRIPQTLLRDTTVTFTSPLYSFYEDERRLRLMFAMSARAGSSIKPFLTIEIQAYVNLENFMAQVKFDHLAVNVDFTHAIWDKLMTLASRRVSILLRHTQFSYLNPLKAFDAQNDRFMREIIYDFHTIDGRLLRMPYKCAHEEMSHSRRMKLFQQANLALHAE